LEALTTFGPSALVLTARQLFQNKKLGQYQSFVARAESGQRRIDVVELLQWAEALDFDPKTAIKHLESIKR
jgi:hypothetical protein